MTVANDWFLILDLSAARTVTLRHRNGRQRYELHLDKVTAARLRHNGYRPVIHPESPAGPIVMFVNDEQWDEWLEWRCDMGGAIWIQMAPDGVYTGVPA